MIALTLFAAFASDSWGQSKQPSQKQETSLAQPKSDAKERATEESPLIVKVLPAEEAKQEADSTEKNRNHQWFNGWTVGDKIAGIASLAGFLQFAALIATLLLMRGTAQRQLRAYVFVDGGSFVLMRTDKGRLFIEANIVLKNFGQTPGYKFVASTRMDVMNTKSPIYEDALDGLGESVIGPGSERHIPVKRGPIDDATLQAIRSGEKSIFIWGRIEYVDAFKHSRCLKFYNMSGRELLESGSTSSGRWPINQVAKPYEAN